MYSRTKTVSLLGLTGHEIEVESDITNGLSNFNIVGLADTSIKESKDRVKSAIGNCGYKFPPGRIVINLSPADLKKEGTQLDLPISISLLMSMGVIANIDINDICIIGELSLDGRVLPVRGALPMIISMREKGYSKFIIPEENKNECSLISDISIYPFSNLKDIISYLNKDLNKEPYKREQLFFNEIKYNIDFSEVKGQDNLKRAMQICAAGHHNILLIGPPGSGKSFSLKRIQTILPDLTFEESIECTKIYSIMGMIDDRSLISKRPFRSPHHTSSHIALIGGGHMIPKPGEISLSHNGVLFLDELPEFSKKTLETLREPLENHEINISRSLTNITYPSNFILIAAMNPCPCGNYGNPNKECRCSSKEISKYLSKISGPLLDRIDLHIEVKPVKYDDLVDKSEEITSRKLKDGVLIAIDRQKYRYKNDHISYNNELNSDLIKKYIILDKNLENIIKLAFSKYKFSARAFNKILKIARTIADLDDKDDISQSHLLEAIRYRTVCQKYWSN